jgi:ferric-dicitrate binding protein FerR (iron transport regulator)
MAEVFDGVRIDRYYKKGEYSEKEATYIENIFCDDTKVKELENLLYKQFNELQANGQENAENLNHILYRIHYEINMKKHEQRIWSFNNVMRWTIRIAGVIILPLVIFFGIHTYKDNRLKKETWIEIMAPAWTRAQFSLPDGTKCWLNSNSAVKYNGNFNVNRKVHLTGEAFFDVFKDKKRPFTVIAGDISVKALGTRFNIASYEDEKNIEVVLEEGKVVFMCEELKKTYTMKPNDLVVFNKMRKEFSTERVQSQKYCSWKEGKLVFRNDPLDVIARRLERWYNVDVDLGEGFSEEIRWRATFIDENLDEVLKFLKRSLPVEYRIETSHLQPDMTYSKDKVIITPRNR